MKKIIKILVVLAIITVIALIAKWIIYINSLNEIEEQKYEIATNVRMGHAVNRSDLIYYIDKGDDYISYRMVLNSNMLSYTKVVYDYLDFGLLYGDLSCVDYEVHIWDANNADEIIYKFKPYERANLNGVVGINELLTFFVEDDELKVYLRYAPYHQLGWKEFGVFGSYIYNFETDEYEAFYEGDNVMDEEFVLMASGILDNYASLCKVINFDEDFFVNNNLGDYSYLNIYTYGEIESRITIEVIVDKLPSDNVALYSMYPDLLSYKDNRGTGDRIYLTLPKETEFDEIIKLFVEDQKEISFENLSVNADESIDGLQHDITSYDEYKYYLDLEKYTVNHYGDIQHVIFKMYNAIRRDSM